MARIDTKSERAKLVARPAPYWHKLRPGCQLGYRAATTGEGSWLARWYDGSTGKKQQKALGAIAETAKKRAFDAAREQAEEWCDRLARGAPAQALTVQDAADGYVAEIRRRDGPAKADRVAADFRRTLAGDPIAGIKLDQLRSTHVEEWRDRISSKPTRVGRGDRLKGTERSAATINRDLVPLRAALNRAYENDEVTSDAAWRRALKPIDSVGRRRMQYLTPAQRAALLKAASGPLKPFLKALCLTPIRPGALAAMTVESFDPRSHVLLVGKDKQGGDRKAPLPPTTAKFFSELAQGKQPGAHLFDRGDGRPWDKDSWKKAIKAAVTAAELPPATAYTLRHSVLTDMVSDGHDLMTVATLAGTSVMMLQEHYAHLKADHAKAALASLRVPEAVAASKQRRGKAERTKRTTTTNSV